jgi:hypothetical protein
MDQQAQAEPILSYALEIGSRQFLLSIRRDATSQWDDYSERHRLRHPEDHHLEAKAFIYGDYIAFQRLRNECLEFTIDAPASESLLRMAVQISESQAQYNGLPSGQIAKGFPEMDTLLKDFFWQEINPLLGEALDRHERCGS